MSRPSTKSRKELRKKLRKNPPSIKKLDSYLTIISRIAKENPAKMSESLDVPLSTLDYHIKKLKILDVIEKIGYGTWKVKDENIQNLYDVYDQTRNKLRKTEPLWSKSGRGVLGKSSEFSESSEMRSHAFQFTVKVPRLEGWRTEKRQTILKKLGVDFKIIPQGERIFVLGSRVWLTNKSIVVWLSESFFVEDPDSGYRYGVYELLRRIRRVEQILKVSFRIGGKHRFRSSRQHHALVKNGLAQQYNQEKKKLYVFDDRGKWLEIDDSNPFDEESGLAELEGVANRGNQGQESRDDIRHIQQVFNEFKDTRVTPQMILDMIHQNSKQMQYYAENIVRHVSVMEKIEGNLDAQTEVFRNIQQVIGRFSK